MVTIILFISQWLINYLDLCWWSLPVYPDSEYLGDHGMVWTMRHYGALAFCDCPEHVHRHCCLRVFLWGKIRGYGRWMGQNLVLPYYLGEWISIHHAAILGYRARVLTHSPMNIYFFEQSEIADFNLTNWVCVYLDPQNGFFFDHWLPLDLHIFGHFRHNSFLGGFVSFIAAALTHCLPKVGECSKQDGHGHHGQQDMLILAPIYGCGMLWLWLLLWLWLWLSSSSF